MIVKRLEPMSVAKIAAALYGIIGLVVGGIFALVSLVGGALSDNSTGAVFAFAFGVGGLVVFPVLYGGIGFLMSLLMAALYNVIAGKIGGVEIQLEPGTLEPGMPPRT